MRSIFKFASVFVLGSIVGIVGEHISWNYKAFMQQERVDGHACSDAASVEMSCTELEAIRWNNISKSNFGIPPIAETVEVREEECSDGCYTITLVSGRGTETTLWLRSKKDLRVTGVTAY